MRISFSRHDATTGRRSRLLYLAPSVNNASEA
jgi:hypothetical protein